MPTDITKQRCIIARKFVLDARKVLMEATDLCATRGTAGAIKAVEEAVASLESALLELRDVSTPAKPIQSGEHWTVAGNNRDKLRVLVPVANESEANRQVDNLRKAGYTNLEVFSPDETPR